MLHTCATSISNSSITDTDAHCTESYITTGQRLAEEGRALRVPGTLEFTTGILNVMLSTTEAA